MKTTHLRPAAQRTARSSYLTIAICCLATAIALTLILLRTTL